MRLLGESSRLLPGFAKRGVVPESGGTWYLPRLVGWAKAAEIGFQLESEGQSEHLSVLEPASWPDYPSTPSRTKFAVLGAFGSLLVAFGIALLLDLMNPVIRSAAVMERDLGFAPVAVIPEAPRSKRRTALMRAFRGRRRAV